MNFVYKMFKAALYAHNFEMHKALLIHKFEWLIHRIVPISLKNEIRIDIVDNLKNTFLTGARLAPRQSASRRSA
jgi:hypothetical protein